MSAGRPDGGEWVLHAARAVFPDGVRAAGLHVRNGRIERVLDVGATVPGVPAHRLGDDEVLLPGFVDTHVHVNDPGRADWEGFFTATRAAAAGGVTTLVDMPLNSIPATVNVDALRQKVGAMAGRLLVDVGLWGGAIPGSIDALADLAGHGVLGFKVFLSPSGVDEFPHVDDATLPQALSCAAAAGLPLLAHAEHPASLRPPVGDPRRHSTWANSRPPEAEVVAIEALARSAAASNARVHVVHVASGAALRAVRAARETGIRMSAETCPHYLAFDGDAVRDGDTRFKCAPPLRGDTERESLWRGLADGTVSMVASDHSPSPPAMKRMEVGDFLSAWGGIASLELAPTVTWSEAVGRGHTLSDLVHWWSAAPARLAGLDARKGTLRVGADADLVAFAPEESWVVDAMQLHHRHAVTPYDGRRLRGRVRATWCRGTLAWDAGAGEFGAPVGAWLRRESGAVALVDPSRAFS